MAVFRSKLTLFVLVLAIAGAIVVAANATPGAAQEDAGSIAHAHADYPFDTGDERLVVGVADNVFVGKVVKRVGAKGNHVPGSSIEQPRTQFAVRVEENIKGELPGNVVVSQLGGQVEYDATADFPEAGVKKGQRVREKVLFNDDPLLEPGREYVFSTGFVPEEGYHQVVVAGAGKDEIRGNEDREQKKAEYEKATREQKDPTKLRD